jgi:predicted phosphodiesterase
MKKFLQKILREPVKRIADKYASRPDKERVHAELTDLYIKIHDTGKRGSIITFNSGQQKFIILSDQHKGAKNGADDFAIAEKSYLKALEYYNDNNYFYIALGDCEELWENTLAAVKKNNVPSFEKEKLFLKRKAFYKIFGNHDLDWDNSPFASIELEKIYGEKVSICEGVVLKTTIKDQLLEIFLTHGHQGDAVSDGNWFSKWFIAKVWGPLQAYLAINPNTPAFEDHLKTDHNRFMYEWIAPKTNMLLITGHTHQPVFESLTHIERLYQRLGIAKETKDNTTIETIEQEIHRKKLEGQTIPDFTAYKSNYFNSGCCCFDDGDITGIEIADGFIRLIKWEYENDSVPVRIVLEETALENLLTQQAL